jgi:hypothetical protein
MKIDPRVAFYLKHQDQIEEWANLGKLIPDLAHEFFCSIEPEIRALAAEFAADFDFNLDDTPDHKRPGFRVWKPSWDTPNLDGPCITLEWERAIADFQKARLGVDCGRNTPFAEPVRNGLAVFFRKGRYLCDTHWAGYRFVVPSHTDYALDLDGFRVEIVAQFRALYLDVEPILTEVTGAVTKSKVKK